MAGLGGLFSGGLLTGKYGNSSPSGPTKSGTQRQGQLGPPAGFENSNANRRILVASDLITLASGNPSSLSNSTFNDLGGIQCPAQTVFRFGFGSPGGGFELNQGFLYFDSKSAAAVARNGYVRYNNENFRQSNITTFLEIRTEQLKTSSITAKSEMYPQPEVEPLIPRDSYLRLRFKPDTNGIDVSNTASTMFTPLTEYF